LTNHPVTAYSPGLRLMQAYADLIPFGEIVTHRYPLEQALEALQTSLQPDSMKVVIGPPL
jgi:threonine dehydrogenase-like Zn-dependent dehydrogenase